MAMEVSGNMAKTHQEAPKAYKATGQAPSITSEVASSDAKVVRSAANEGQRSGGNKVAKDGEGERAGEFKEKKLKDAVSRMNSQMKLSKNRCEFSYHETTKRVSIKVVDEETSEVIREIPPEEALEMFEKMLEIAGLLIDEKR